MSSYRKINIITIYIITKYIMGVNMKTISSKQFDENDEEIADALISLGMTRNAANALTYMRNTNSATTTDLERSARLRQPEVSIAMKQLIEHDWINESEEKKPGKGRPNKVYSLKIGFMDIINQLEKKQKKAVEEAKGKIMRLKELGKL
jgi:predicted transcriptional regulator